MELVYKTTNIYEQMFLLECGVEHINKVETVVNYKGETFYRMYFVKDKAFYEAKKVINECREQRVRIPIKDFISAKKMRWAIIDNLIKG